MVAGFMVSPSEVIPSSATPAGTFSPFSVMVARFMVSPSEVIPSSATPARTCVGQGQGQGLGVKAQGQGQVCRKVPVLVSVLFVPYERLDNDSNQWGFVATQEMY
jgi:hypothetical protein